MRKSLYVRRYQLTCKKNIGQGSVRFAYISDLHNKLDKAEEKEILDQLEKMDPDMILIGGDLVVAHGIPEINKVLEFLQVLTGKWKVYYAYGNHEQRMMEEEERYEGQGEVFEKELNKLKQLNRVINEKIEFEVNGIPFCVYGLCPNAKFYQRGCKRKGMKEEIDRLLGKTDSSRYTILLAHNPRYAKEYMEWQPNLILSGHYHGGVILLDKHRGVITPDYQIFSPYCCGLYEREETAMIISAGIGEHTIPVRIHNPRELTEITIFFE